MGRVALDTRNGLDAEREAVIAVLRNERADGRGSVSLRPVTGQSLTGSSPKMIGIDRSGQRFLFKPVRANSFAYEREVAARSIRELAKQPTVAVLKAKMTLDDGTVVHGYAKPMVGTRGDLENDPRDWNAAQIHCVLQDAAFAELLGNYDTRPGQYITPVDAKTGAVLALNVDWDRTFSEYAKNSELSRFKRHFVAPPAASLLYAQYVRGAPVDFSALWDAIDRIDRVKESDYAKAVNGFAKVAFPDSDARKVFVAFAMERKRTLRHQFKEAIAALDEERASGVSRVNQLRDLEFQGSARFADSPAYRQIMAVRRKVSHRIPNFGG
nr:DNA polymerase [uncultured bacterium]